MGTLLGVVVVGAAVIGLVLRRRAHVCVGDEVLVLKARLEAAETALAALDAQTRRLAREHDHLSVLIRRRANCAHSSARSASRLP